MRAPARVPAALPCALFLAAALLVAIPAVAQFPMVMNYQVMLTDDLDQPLADQTVDLVFRLYEAESGGVAGWTETHSTTTNSIGVASVLLGSTNPLPSSGFPGFLWLEIQVEGEVMSPRRRLASAPYALDALDSHWLGGVAAGEYATYSELSTPGTINYSSNPVDWTKLKNVPAGFADGLDDSGGAGDGHSLDADDGSPVDALYVDQGGHVGIGTTTPAGNLHVHDVDGTSGVIHLTNAYGGGTGTDGVKLGMATSAHARLVNYESGQFDIGTDGDKTLRLEPGGIVNIGLTAGVSGDLKIFGGTGGVGPLHRSFEDDYGGRFELTDELGNVAVTFGADQNDSGGRLMIQRNAVFDYNEGIDLNGNWNFTEDPALRVMGSGRSAFFYMSEEGNNSVMLPGSSIYSFETSEEPGVASTLYGGSTGFWLDSSPAVLASSSVITPASGYVMALATCQVTFDHTVGDWESGTIGVSDNDSSFPENQDVDLALDQSLGSGVYRFAAACHGLFEVTGAGTHTFYFLGVEDYGDIRIFDVQFTLVYFRTAYGTVDPTLPADSSPSAEELVRGRAGLTQAEIAAERADAQAFHLARIERELAEIKAQVEAMKEERR